MHLTPCQIDNAQANSKLLNLPPELRNRIYEYCLKAEYQRGIYKFAGPWKIDVTDGPKPPGFLFTCKQVREDASKIWYLGNELGLEIENYDAATLVAWEKLCRQINETLGARPVTGMTVLLTAHWKNLKQWCHYLWAAKLPFVKQFIEEPNDKVLYSAQTTAQECQGLPREKCERMLDAFRGVAGEVDNRWLDD